MVPKYTAITLPSWVNCQWSFFSEFNLVFAKLICQIRQIGQILLKCLPFTKEFKLSSKFSQFRFNAFQNEYNLRGFNLSRIWQIRQISQIFQLNLSIAKTQMSDHQIWFLWWITWLCTDKCCVCMCMYACITWVTCAAGCLATWIKTLFHTFILPDLADLVARHPVLNLENSSMI